MRKQYVQCLDYIEVPHHKYPCRVVQESIFCGESWQWGVRFVADEPPEEVYESITPDCNLDTQKEEYAEFLAEFAHKRLHDLYPG